MDNIGKIFETNNGKVKIIEYYNSYNSTISFEDGTIMKNIQYGNIKSGNIKNPNFKSIFNIGYIGQGKYDSKNNKSIYIVWKSMLTRCYSLTYQTKQKTYIDCIVDEKWHNFQNFSEWYINNYVDNWCLDKDILINGNKIYSENTCCFVPNEINLLFTKSNKQYLNTGVYKTKYGYISQICKFNEKIHLGTYNTPEEAFKIYKINKESYIKEVAEKWKNKINEKVYQAMLNYQIF